MVFRTIKSIELPNRVSTGLSASTTEQRSVLPIDLKPFQLVSWGGMGGRTCRRTDGLALLRIIGDVTFLGLPDLKGDIVTILTVINI